MKTLFKDLISIFSLKELSKVWEETPTMWKWFLIVSTLLILTLANGCSLVKGTPDYGLAFSAESEIHYSIQTLSELESVLETIDMTDVQRQLVRQKIASLSHHLDKAKVFLSKFRDEVDRLGLSPEVKSLLLKAVEKAFDYATKKMEGAK